MAGGRAQLLAHGGRARVHVGGERALRVELEPVLGVGGAELDEDIAHDVPAQPGEQRRMRPAVEVAARNLVGRRHGGVAEAVVQLRRLARVRRPQLQPQALMEEVRHRQQEVESW